MTTTTNTRNTSQIASLRRLRMSTSTTNIHTNIAATNNYRKVAEQLPQEALLGQLLWFTVSGADVNLEQARQALADLGLSDNALPKMLQPSGAFRRAVRDVGRRFREVDDTRSELLVRSVGDDGDKMYRHLMLERADYRTGQKRQVSYVKVGEITFTRGTRTKQGYTGHSVDVVDTSHNAGDLLPEEREWLDAALGGFQDRFQHLLTHMDSQAVRNYVRSEISRMDGVCVKESGGVYFIAQANAGDLKALNSWVKSVGSYSHLVPLLDLTDQRQMIAQAFEEETVAEVQRMMDEIAAILREGKTIEERTFDAYGTKAADLTRRINEYAALLGDRSELAALQVNLFTGQLVQLAGQVRQLGTPRRVA